jgi:hypothetical protein
MSPARHPARPSDAPPAAPPVDPSDTLAASAMLRRSATVLSLARESRAGDSDGADHWPPDAHAPDTAESRERLAHTAERLVWVTQDSAERAFARDVSAYTRLLRDGGMRPRQAVAAVAAVVREGAAPSLDGERLDAAIHDAGRYCVEAYFAR